MRLLVLTQKVDKDDDVLGFFHRWLVEFAKHCEQVTVVALSVGEYNLPSNVKVFSLGKEKKRNSLQKLFTFYFLLFTLRKEYDAVFVHMNPIYVILGGLFWRAESKKIGLWYTHKHVDLKLRFAEWFSDILFTASRESFRLPSSKVNIVGHGIDTEAFKPAETESHEILQVVTVGRISPVKDYRTLIRVIEILVHDGVAVEGEIIGGPVTVSDEDYFKELLSLVREKGLEKVIHFVGSVSNKDLPTQLAGADIFVNMSGTGSLDKAVLEAMSCGVPVVTSNEALGAVLGADAPTLMFATGDVKECVKRIKILKALPVDDRKALSKRLREVVEKEHNIEMLIPRILLSYERGQ